ncbi:MAG: helix-hairpin-helix domain-containing protein [Tissierellaceae bacterium]|nr:helix-hairpin-helix domain-containing protein [Tissierellaceae bacterium]
MTFTKREQIAILVIALIMIFTLGFKFVKKEITKPKELDLEIYNEEPTANMEEFEDEEDEDEFIMVHISGQINFPGVIEIKKGKRLIDAVEMLGGLKKEADIDRINLAKKLEDEEKIYIPKIGEEPGETVSYSTVETKSEGKININKASKSELSTLPGIGEILADRIIQYREETPFKTIEDIKNVSGIGDKKFESVKELIIAN